MNGQITPEQAEVLLMFASLILVAVVMRLLGLAAWHKWFADAQPDDLTQEERDDRRIARRRRPR